VILEKCCKEDYRRTDEAEKVALNNFVLQRLKQCLLISWSRVFLEKLTGSQLVKKFPAFYGTRRFITALTSSRHLSLS
jgi:hypothetical protein